VSRPALDAALALFHGGDFHAAAGLLERVCNDAPNDPHARFLLGACRHALGELNAALAAFDAATALAPDHLEAAQAAVAVLCQLGRPRDALARCERLLAHAPRDAQVQFNVALVHEAGGDPGRALAHYDAALALEPARRDARLNRGVVLLRLGRADEALENNRALAAAHPGDPDAQANLAETSLACSRYEEALAEADRAAALAPRMMGAQFTRGLALAALGRIEEAEQAFAAARGLDPAAFAAREASVARGATTGGPIDAREIYLVQAFEAAESCDWATRDRFLERFTRWIREPGARPLDAFPLAWRAAVMGLAPADQARIAANVTARISRGVHPLPPRPPAEPSARVRIGYVAAEFRAHPVAWLTEGLYARHDRARFEVFAYALTGPDGDPVRDRIAAGVDVFRDVAALPTADIAAQIRADRIDVLVDLAGYLTDARPELPASRPAPVNVAYIGYPATCGGPHVDYMIVDRVAVPAGAERDFAERLVFLPDTFWCYGCPPLAPAPERTSLALPERGFVFAAFHNAFKIGPEIFGRWMTLLDRVPGSVLWLLTRREAAAGHLRREAERRGVDPARIVFAPPMAHGEHLARQQAADLFLDTPGCSAATTCLDALWSGLPVLACPTASFAGRQSASALAALGLAELIADGLDDYVARGVRFASDPAALADLRRRLAVAKRERPLFDTTARVRELEAAFRTMVDRAREGLPPAAMEIGPGGHCVEFVK
jgi:predicted O-linked N-acetylglucosamine transferase (SPINDLY family)